jgi:hypothetical protein
MYPFSMPQEEISFSSLFVISRLLDILGIGSLTYYHAKQILPGIPTNISLPHATCHCHQHSNLHESSEWIITICTIPHHHTPQHGSMQHWSHLIGLHWIVTSVYCLLSCSSISNIGIDGNALIELNPVVACAAKMFSCRCIALWATAAKRPVYNRITSAIELVDVLCIILKRSHAICREI